jgi:signal transduction histidine kinase
MKIPGWRASAPGSLPEWVLAARLLPALLALSGLGRVHPVGARVALILVIVAYAAWATVVDRARAGAVAKIPQQLVLACDLGLVALAGALAVRAGFPAAVLVAAVPVVAIHTWAAGRTWGLAAGAGSLAVTAVIDATYSGRGLRPVELALVGALLLWTLFGIDQLTATQHSAQARIDLLQGRERELVMNVSHELRTPLTVIQGIVATLASRWTSLTEPERLDMIDAITVNVASLDSSVLHFIDAGKIVRGEMDVRPEAVTLQPVIDRVKAKLANALGGYEVQVNLKAPQVYADPDALERVLELLVGNAARFSPIGSAISVTSRSSGAEVEVSVRDHGQGISPAHLERVFDPFWRADVAESGVSRGAGLGLAIVKDLVERQGGEVGVTSARNRGSTFWFTLPEPTSPDLSSWMEERAPATATAAAGRSGGRRR